MVRSSSGLLPEIRIWPRSVAASVFFVLVGIASFLPLPPSASIWESGSDVHHDNLQRRRRIAWWLTLTNEYTGRTRAEIVGALGPPTAEEKFGPSTIAYEVGPLVRSQYQTQSLWLVFRFSAAGNATPPEMRYAP